MGMGSLTKLDETCHGMRVSYRMYSLDLPRKIDPPIKEYMSIEF